MKSDLLYDGGGSRGPPLSFTLKSASTDTRPAHAFSTRGRTFSMDRAPCPLSVAGGSCAKGIPNDLTVYDTEGNPHILCKNHANKRRKMEKAAEGTGDEHSAERHKSDCRSTAGEDQQGLRLCGLEGRRSMQ